METQTQKRWPSKDVLTILTEKVIEQLKKGIVPWRVSWVKAGLPENLISHFPYHGINRILLATLGYERNVFLTSKQLKAINGTLIPEEKPHIIGYLNDNKEGDGSETTIPAETTGSKKPMKLRFYTVFNIAQCSIPAETAIPPVTAKNDELQIGVEMKAKDQRKAFYDPLKDSINLPGEKQYGSIVEYSREKFHQLIHSTGHYTRLNRSGLIQMSEFGYDSFSLEELIAEIGTSYLMNYFGMEDSFVASPEYIAGWLKRFEENRWLMYSASYQAEKAIRFLFIGEVDEKDMVRE